MDRAAVTVPPVDAPFTPGPLPPPLTPGGLANAPAPTPAHSPFLGLVDRHPFANPEVEPPAPLTSGRMATGIRAAAAGDLDIAIFAFVRAANDFRMNRQPTFEAFALVELAAIYHQENRLERLPSLARRARKIEEHGALSPEIAAIVLLAVDVIERAIDEPAGLRIFRDPWSSEPGWKVPL